MKKNKNGYFKGLWHRKRHAISSSFTRSPTEYTLEILGLFAWLSLVISARDELTVLVLMCALVMLIARAFPVIKAIFWSDKAKLNFLKQRRVESNTCLREINTSLVNPKHANPEKIKEIRQRLLSCIVDTVRAYRNDLPGSKIYSNLLIPDGEDLIVSIRNAPDRANGTRYKKSKLACSIVLTSKKPMYHGDINSITERDLSYKSFMAIPVLDYTQTECLAIVTIDSAEFHHFDEIYESFDTLLSPYITTITTTFILEKRYKQEAI
ncbi:MAG: hypothetical protein V3U87_10985 [Methylococcaceae bacterium]